MLGDDEGPEDNDGSWDGRGLTLGCEEVEGLSLGLLLGVDDGSEEVEGLSLGLLLRVDDGSEEGSIEG